ncbi:MAG: hypothetical protein J6U23_13305 [Clostridiales bacterium]|nr:hypothetical protein [Clostridiales bacterium]
MASNGQIKGITIKIEGDTSPLARDLQSVNRDISQTQRALRDVQRALELDPTNVELLAQQEQLLNRQIEQTSQKLEIEQQAAEDAREALEIGSISQEEYATLQAEVVRTASSLGELEEQAASSADGLNDTGEAAEEAGDSAEDSAESFENWGEVIKVAAEAAVAAIAAVGAAVGAAAGALVSATTDTAALADEILTLSSVTSLSTDTLQEMNYASELLDVSTDTMTGAMTRMVRSLDEAATGTGAAAEAYAALGVSVTDSSGNLRDTEDIFWDVVDSLGEIENATERDAIAMNLLGRSSRELNPLIEAGSEGFAQLAEEAHETGYVMSGSTLDAFGELDDNLQRLNNGTTAARNAIGQVLLPVLTDLSSDGVSLLNDFTNAILDTNGDVEQMGAVIEEMVPQVISLIESYLPIVIELGGSIIESLASAILDNLDVILSACVSLIGVIGQGIIDNLGSLAPVISDLIVGLSNFIINNLGTIVNAALDIVLAVANGISENLDELIPAAVSAVLTICESLLDHLDEIILASYQLLLGVASGIVQSIPDIVAEIPSLIASILNALGELSSELPAMAQEWGSDLISSFRDSIVNAIPNLISGVEQVASSVADYLHFSVPDKGPLADFDESGADMIDEFIKSMQSEDYTLEKALTGTANLIYNGMNPEMDYSGALSGISSQLAGMGGSKTPQVINVYIGNQKFASAVVGATAQENYRAGGIG